MTEREHLFKVTVHDCVVQTFRAGGKGGQNQNKRDSGVRIIHRPSGAVGESREERGQLQNKRKAFRKMAESAAFQTWAHSLAARIPPMPPVEELVDALMAPENLKVEVRTLGGWVDIGKLIYD